MKKLIPLIFSVIILSGCLERKVTSRSPLDTASESQLKSECQQMAENGDLRALMREIHEQTDQILTLSSAVDTLVHRQEIEDLGAEIHDKVTRARALIQPEWTTSKWNYEVQWSIDDKDLLKIKGPEFFEFQSVKVESVILEGIQRPDLINQINLKVDPRKILVGLKKMANSLEICQMQETFSVVVEVHYRFLFYSYKKYFRLGTRPSID